MGFPTRGNFFGGLFFFLNRNVSEAGVLFIEDKVNRDARPAPVWPAWALVTASPAVGFRSAWRVSRTRWAAQPCRFLKPGASDSPFSPSLSPI